MTLSRLALIWLDGEITRVRGRTRPICDPLASSLAASYSLKHLETSEFGSIQWNLGNKKQTIPPEEEEEKQQEENGEGGKEKNIYNKKAFH